MRKIFMLLIAVASALGAVTLGSAAASASIVPGSHYLAPGNHRPVPGSYGQPGPVRDRFACLPGGSRYFYSGYPYCGRPAQDPQPAGHSFPRRMNAWESFVISQHGNSPVQPATASGLLVSGPGYFTQAGRDETGHFDGATFTVAISGGSDGTFAMTGGTGQFRDLSGSGTYQVTPAGPRSRHSETITAAGDFSQGT